MNDKELATQILRLIGDKENISTATHCVTRLRVTVNQLDNVKRDEIAALPGVLGTNIVGQQFQVILGNRVNSVYDSFMDNLGEFDVSNNQTPASGNLVSRFLDFLSAIFVPIIPAIIGAGLLKGILILLMFYNLVSTNSDTYRVLSIFSDAAFFFLPILLAVSAAEKFKVNKFVAAAIGGILVHPDLIALMGNGHNPVLFGIPFTATSYASSVLPIILGVWVMSYIEKLLFRYVPKILQTVLVPLLTLLIVAPILLAVLGPIGTIIGNGLGAGFVTLYQKGGLFAGALLGAAYPFLVLLGMHVGLTPIMVQSLSKYGVDYMMGLFVASNSAQAGATSAVYFKTKNKELKEIAGTAAINAIIGVTEPALFGVTSKLKKPLIAVAIGGGIGGAIAGATHVAATGIGTGPIAGIPLFFGKTFIFFVISSIVAFIVSFIMTFVIGFKDLPNSDDDSVTSPVEPDVTQVHTEDILSPISGNAMPLSTVKDQVFSTGMMGNGIAIDPTDDLVHAPFNGAVEMVFETKHAIGLVSDAGTELLLHVGLDTVELKGQYFEVLVTQGQPLLKFDRTAIAAAGYDVTIPIVVTNTPQYDSVKDLVTGPVTTEQSIIQVKVN